MYNFHVIVRCVFAVSKSDVGLTYFMIHFHAQKKNMTVKVIFVYPKLSLPNYACLKQLRMLGATAPAPSPTAPTP